MTWSLTYIILIAAIVLTMAILALPTLISTPQRVLRVGVAGYCPPSVFDVKLAKQMLNAMFDRALSEHQGVAEVEVISGLSYVGVPALAYDIAEERGFKLRGIAPTAALPYPRHKDCSVEIVGEKFGDESVTFIHSIDILIRLGGGPQTLKETRMFKELHKKGKNRLYEEELYAYTP